MTTIRRTSEQPSLLPVSRTEMDRLGWDDLDVLLVTGDAYVDHPVFGAALLGRWLVAHGYRVGVVPQPRWDNVDDVVRMGRPRLFAGVTAGALDSMLAHYTAFRKKRHDDAYTPGGRAGARPNRACIVYAGLLKRAFPRLPIVLGGIEASLRRITHYDFWKDGLRRSILLDGKADLILYGMAERAILAVARLLESGATDLDGGTRFAAIPGAVFIGREGDVPQGASVIALPSHEEIEGDPRKLMEATLAMERQVQEATSWATQRVGDRTLIISPPASMSTEELDALYALPFTRSAHPSYEEPVPAEEMIRFSVTTHRGCGGGCAFCSLALHQGRRISSRSAASILEEVERLTGHPVWKGSISDVGGPSANMWGAGCGSDPACCGRASCLYPEICRHFKADQAAMADLLRAIGRMPKVKHVRVASGVRFDLALKDPAYLEALIGEFVGGQLKVAPEHICDSVLRLMRKPKGAVFGEFIRVFEEESAKAGREQYLIPYLVSAFPGCTDGDMERLARWLQGRGWRPQQVQCFIPTPGTVATAMYCAGIDPAGNPICVARTDAERMRQHYILLRLVKARE